MKSFRIIAHCLCGLIIVVTLYACDDMAYEQMVVNNDSIHNIDHVSLNDAIEMANKHFGLSRANDEYEVSYILPISSNTSRAESGIDTLAYVLNRKNNAGFFIVAYPTIDNPILAFSNEGEFKYQESTEDVIYTEFIGRLENYFTAPNLPEIPEWPDSIPQINFPNQLTEV